MKKQKISKQNNQKINKKTVNPLLISTISLAIISIVLGGLLIASHSKMKSHEEEEYLSVYPSLLSNYIEYRCDSESLFYTEMYQKQQPESHVCTMSGYGLTDDNNPYVVYYDQAYNRDTHEQNGAPEKRTVYFQHYDDGYAEAVGTD